MPNRIFKRKTHSRIHRRSYRSNTIYSIRNPNTKTNMIHQCWMYYS